MEDDDDDDDDDAYESLARVVRLYTSHGTK
jgi:hypothetical protein